MAIKKMKATEFRDFGFLQEANRQFFHPLGLALEILVKTNDKDDKIADTGEILIAGIWDYRNDPEGIIFGKDMIDKDKAGRVEQLKKSKIENRKKYNCDENGIEKIEE